MKDFLHYKERKQFYYTYLFCAKFTKKVICTHKNLFQFTRKNLYIFQRFSFREIHIKYQKIFLPG